MKVKPCNRPYPTTSLKKTHVANLNYTWILNRVFFEQKELYLRNRNEP